MAEILGIGCTHRPVMLRPNDAWTFMMKASLDDPDMPAEMKDPSRWPPQLREELGSDFGKTSAGRARQVFRRHFAEARRALDEFKPDVVIMDITMPECNGIEATRHIKRLLPDVRVLVLTMHENEEYLFQTLRAGAAGYMLKEAADTDLISAIRVVASGRFYLSPSAQSMLVSDYLQRVHTGEERDSYSALTEREREILKLVAEGYTNSQIGERLFISPKTVDTHRTHVMDKLNLHNRAELVRYAMRRGLLED